MMAFWHWLQSRRAGVRAEPLAGEGLRAISLVVWLLAAAAAATGAELEGRWHARVWNPAGDPVHFLLELTRSGDSWRGALVNGSDRQESSAASVDGVRLRLEFNYWDGVLEAQLRQGRLEGSFMRTYRKNTLTRRFLAQREPFYTPRRPPGASLSGEWIFEVKEADKTSVWRASFQQNGNHLEGVLMPVSGDSGLLVGYIEEGRLELSRFDGIRATLVRARLLADGTLEGAYNSVATLRGRRATSSSAPKPPSAAAYTRLRRPEEAFRFSFPDLEGRLVSSSDPLFRGKALIVTIMGSWCPNCHDEAAFLKELSDRYGAQGLRIVALAFEYTGNAERDIRQLRLFQQKHRIAYPILYAGSTDEAAEKLSQLENFGAYPTTLFIDRNGRVRAIHAGFDGPATGARHIQLKREIEDLVKQLLAP